MFKFLSDFPLHLNSAAPKFCPIFPAIPITESHASKKISSTFSASSATKVIRLISVLNLFPTTYFSHSEKDVVCVLLIIIEKLISRARLLYEKSISDDSDLVLLQCAAITRKIIARFLYSRQDMMITVSFNHLFYHHD